MIADARRYLPEPFYPCARPACADEETVPAEMLSWWDGKTVDGFDDDDEPCQVELPADRRWQPNWYCESCIDHHGAVPEVNLHTLQQSLKEERMAKKTTKPTIRQRLRTFGEDAREWAAEKGNDVAEWFDDLVETAEEKEAAIKAQKTKAELDAVTERLWDAKNRVSTLESERAGLRRTIARLREQRRWAWTTATILGATAVALAVQLL